MKIIIITGLLLAIFFTFNTETYAIELPREMILKTDFRIWKVNLSNKDLISDYQKNYFQGYEIGITDKQFSIIKNYIQKNTKSGLDLIKIKTYLEQKIAPVIYREREDVKIILDDDGKVVFEGRGLYGRKLDLEKAAFMLKEAIEKEIEFIDLPIIREEPQVVNLSEELKEVGIKELVAAGETDFNGSPYNRIANIKLGLSRFNGHIIQPGEEFVFGEVLGPVNKQTGYLPELVIKKDRTVPEYGGGLCQVSTTAYRAILAGGLPVTERRNHSFAVHYYAPTGLDATVYPPTVNLKFVNDYPNHLLMQTFTIGNKAYFNIYGIKDARQVYMLGPYYYNHKAPPTAKIEYSEKLKPGEKLILGKAVWGVTSSWYRQVVYNTKNKESLFEHIFSKYQARPDFHAVGVEKNIEY